MSEEKPLHVLFAEKCMGWERAELIDAHTEIVPKPNGPIWIGQPPNVGRARMEIPRVDLPGYDLMPWEEANKLDVYWARVEGMWVAEPFSSEWQVFQRPDKHRRCAVLRCLIALADAGKMVKP